MRMKWEQFDASGNVSSAKFCQVILLFGISNHLLSSNLVFPEATQDS